MGSCVSYCSCTCSNNGAVMGMSHGKRMKKYWGHWRFVFDSLHFNETDFKKFFHIFGKLDPMMTGAVSIESILRYLHITNTKYLSKIFGLFDSEGKGNLSFIEFVLAVWNFCTEHYSGLLAYSVKKLLKLDNQGHVSKLALRQLFLEIYVSIKRSKRSIVIYESSIDFILKSQPESMAHSDVVCVVLFNPSLSVPITGLHGLVKDQFMHRKRWKFIADQPITLLDGKQIGIAEFKEKGMFMLLLQQGEQRLLDSMTTKEVREIIASETHLVDSGAKVLAEAPRKRKKSGDEQESNSFSSNFSAHSHRIFPILADVEYPNGQEHRGVPASARSIEDETKDKMKYVSSLKAPLAHAKSGGLKNAWADQGPSGKGDLDIVSFHPESSI